MKADRSSIFPLTISTLKHLIHPGSGATKDASGPGLTLPQKLVQITGIDRTWQTLQPLMKRLVNAMTPTTEPRVEWRRDRQGNSYFAVYDPITGRSHYFSSAHEVRAWLEQRYY